MLYYNYPILYYTLRERNGSSLQHPCLGNPMDRGARWATAHGVARSRLDWATDTFTFILYSTIPSPVVFSLLRFRSIFLTSYHTSPLAQSYSHLKIHRSQVEDIIIVIPPSKLSIFPSFLFPRMNSSLYLVVQVKNLGIILGQPLSLESLLLFPRGISDLIMSLSITHRYFPSHSLLLVYQWSSYFSVFRCSKLWST